jgi:RNA polymerase sigma-70 factor, ECF subfamily
MTLLRLSMACKIRCPQVNRTPKNPSFYTGVNANSAIAMPGTIRHPQHVAKEDVQEIPEDGNLAAAARQGNHLAFSRLYDRYARMVHGILLARVPRCEVDDLVQDVFLAAWRRLPSLRETNAFGGWLCMIARNRATDYHRTAPAITTLEDATLQQNPPPPEALAVLDTIRQLPEAYRETLILRLVEGMTAQEISDRVGITPESVRVNLHRGMKILRERLEPEVRA